jgi:arylsulfatase A-like enzyme
MRFKTIIKTGLFAVLVLGATLGLLRDKVLLYLPGIVHILKSPIAENRDVQWQQMPSAPREGQPNVILILADDLGFNDLSMGGQNPDPTVQTPNIDAIASAGITFTNGYAASATCAPSRASLLTGRYATRFGFEYTPAPKEFMQLIYARGEGKEDIPSIYHKEREDLVPPMEEMGIPSSEITLAELLKAKHYRSIMLGKWHLGEESDMRPGAQGFDEWLGFLPGASLYQSVGHGGIVESRQSFDPIDEFLWANIGYAVRFNGSDRFNPKGYMTDYLTTEAIKAVAANRDNPFFLYLSYNAPHTPLQAKQADYDALSHITDHTERVYAAMIKSLDDNVGKLMSALKDQGLEDNTIVIFTTDNGGAHYLGLPDVNAPYRGWKATYFEGGIHAPFFMKWPAKIPAGKQYDQPVISMDIFSTIAAAAGAELPADRVIDGVNLLPYIQGEKTGAPRDAIFWYQAGYEAVISNGWKLQRSDRADTTWLFNLKDDPTETTNIAEQNPSQVGKMLAMIDEFKLQQAEPRWPALLEKSVPIDKTMAEPYEAGDEHVFWGN